MKISFFCLLFLLTFVPQAQAYKCKQPSGAVSFQDQPCATDAVGAALKLPPPEDAATAEARAQKPATFEKSSNAKASPQSVYEQNRQRQDAEEVRAQNAKNDAHNKSLRCNAARRQLGIAKEQVPLFSRDNKGERQYVKDEDRAAVIARAQKSVDEQCN